MPIPRRYDPRMDELLRRSRAAILHSKELIAKTRELERQANQLKSENLGQRGAESFAFLKAEPPVLLEIIPKPLNRGPNHPVSK
jgi:hypothetical protein